MAISMLQTSCKSGIVVEVEGDADDRTSQGVEFTDIYGSTAIILSWLTNAIATTSIAYKAW